MPKPKFSIITPVHLWNAERVNSFLKTIESIKAQTFRDFEWIVIDDGSTQDFLWDNVQDAHSTVLLDYTSHQERVIAYNMAFKQATGEWFVLLDSDDELLPTALERMNRMIEKYPTYKMFNFGCRYKHKDGDDTFRDPFEPKALQAGHEPFGGGNIVNGTFIWHKDVYDDLRGFPGDFEGMIRSVDTAPINYGGTRDLFMGSPYDFSAAAQLQFPELQEFFMVNHENEPQKIIKELGNPWGQDYYLFYKYTRKYHSKPMKEYLYIVHPR